MDQIVTREVPKGNISGAVDAELADTRVRNPQQVGKRAMTSAKSAST